MIRSVRYSSKKRSTKRLEFFDHSITKPLPGINGTIGIHSIQHAHKIGHNDDKSWTMFETPIHGSETLYNYQSPLPSYVTRVSSESSTLQISISPLLLLLLVASGLRGQKGRSSSMEAVGSRKKKIKREREKKREEIFLPCVSKRRVTRDDSSRVRVDSGGSFSDWEPQK